MNSQTGVLRIAGGRGRTCGAGRRSFVPRATRHTPLFISTVLVLWIFGTSHVCHAANAPDELLKLVPADAGVCLELRDLQHELPRIHDSKVAARFRETPIYREWTASRQHEQFQRIASAIEKGTGQPLAELAGQLFGRYVVLAVLQTPNKPPAGVLLTRVSSGEFLQKAVATWNALEGKEPAAREHAGQTYFAASRPARTKRPPETVYYFARNDVLALSDNESVIQRVAALSRGLAGNDNSAQDVEQSLFANELYLQAQASLAPQPPISIYLNPRAWDGTLGIERAAQSEDATARLAAQAWRSCRSLALGVRAHEGVVAELVAHCDPEVAGTGWKELASHASGIPGFLARTPADVLGVTTGHGTFGEFIALVVSIVRTQDPAGAERARQVANGLLLGRDVLTDVLQPLRGDWGFYVRAAAPAAAGASEAETPLEAVAAWELPEPNRADLKKSIQNALDFGLNMWTVERNSRRGAPLSMVRSASHAGVEVRWLDGIGFVRPAYAFADRYFVVATSPEAVADFVQRKASDSLLQLSDYKRWSEAHFSEASHVTFLNVAAVRQMMAERRPVIVQQIAKLRNATAEQVESRLARLDPLLNLVDGAFATATIAPDRVRLVFGAVGDSERP